MLTPTRPIREGFGVPVSYGRLREACQTDVDGTSIDAMEEIAIQLGLEAEQIVLPADFLLLEEAQALPGIVVVRNPNGVTHFVVAWRRHGRFVQVMDPAIGRRWMPIEDFRSQVYIHTMAVKSADWREWAASEKFLRPLRRKLATLGVSERTSVSLVDRAVTEPAWDELAALDAATPAVESMVEAGALRRGHEPGRAVEHLVERARKGQDSAIPEDYWSARPSPPSATGEEQLLVFVVRVSGVRPQAVEESKSSAISPELVAAIAEQPNRPGHELFRLLRADGALGPAMIVCALLLAATLLGDQYFHSRLTSDMAERGHLIYRVRSLPNLGGQLVRAIFELVLTTLGIIWLDESVAWIAITAAITSFAFPLLAQPALAERDLRLKSHSGALSRFYLDALLGLVPIRVHGAERALRREHESALSAFGGHVLSKKSQSSA